MKLTLRDLFWLVLVVGMVCAWWMDRASLLDRQKHFDARLLQHGYAFEGDKLIYDKRLDEVRKARMLEPKEFLGDDN